MKFVHISDNHLGFRQYGLFEREIDYYEVFDDIIEKIIEERPNFVIHSGDLFEFSRPPTKALLTVQKRFFELKNKNIPIYAIAGNHDIIMRKNAIPPQVLYKEFGLNLISLNNPLYIKNDIFIGGMQYASRMQYASKYDAEFLVEHLNFLENESKKYKKKILVLHQAIDKYLPFDYELKLADLPESFNYYAMGHIHQRIVDDYGDGKLVYPGTPEIWRMDELEGYKKNGKGFYIVDMGGDIPEVEKVDLKLPREIIRENVKYFELNDKINRIRDYILKLDKKPLMHITIEGGNFERIEVYEKLKNAFNNICLSVRPNYKPESLLDDSNSESEVDELLDPKEIIRDKLKVFNNEKISDFAINILNEISDGEFKKAEEIAEEFYEEVYDN